MQQEFYDFSLKKYNTFGIDVNAKHFINVETTSQLEEIIKRKIPFFILGGGSNMLLTKPINKTVLQINIKGIEVYKEDQNTVWVKANAGETWHDLVMWCIENNYGGIENLALIPGNVGAAPIQNIGAYGVELKDVFYECKAIEIKSGKKRRFNKEDCQFGYRDSIFKNSLRDTYIITSVVLQLSKTNHQLKTSYGAISSELQNYKTISIKNIAQAVIKIRNKKLPDPNKIGNSGSFFKNPVVNKNVLYSLNQIYTEVPTYALPHDFVKIPAAWLIEKAGFKGKKFNNYGVHKNQALVLVNYGGAKGDDLYNLALLIQKTVNRIFDITLEVEVNIF